MAKVQDHANAAYLLMASDGNNTGVKNGYDNEAEAQAAADAFQAVAPAGVTYSVSNQNPFIQQFHDRVAVLEETNSFLSATTEQALTVGNVWVQVTGLVVGPANCQVAEPDLVLAEDGATVSVMRAGKYFLQVNCQFISATADGWFEPAIEPIGICAPLWPTGVNVGHVGDWVPAAAIDWPNATLGKAATIQAPLLVGDEITATCKYCTADGEGTITLSAVVYALRIGN